MTVHDTHNNTEQTQQTVDSGARKRIKEQQMIATAALLQLMSNPKKTNKRNAQMMDINGHINDLYCALATATAAVVHSQVHTQWLPLMQYKFSARYRTESQVVTDRPTAERSLFNRTNYSSINEGEECY
uniref:Uncharacterized protein n=1 Tax=Glossina austeni TaxID=7395 RepID=A0A1A9VJ90_GLOAU